MTHLEDLLANTSGSMVRRLTEGVHACRRRATLRKETRFGVYLYGPEYNNDDEPGRRIAALFVPAVDGGEINVDQICRSFIDAQRRAYAETGAIRGPIEIRFLAEPSREELSSSRRWEHVVCGPRPDEFEHWVGEPDEELGFLDLDDHGTSPDDDGLGLAHTRDADYERTMRLASSQRELVKDIERDSMLKQLFDQVMVSRENDMETLREALAFQRHMTLKALGTFGGCGGREEETASPASGMRLASDAVTLWQAMSGSARRGPNQGRALPHLDAPIAARPAVPRSAFNIAAWDGGTRQQGAAVDRFLSARSTDELSDRTRARRARVPAVRQAGPTDLGAILASMDNAELIRAVGGRIGDIAGPHASRIDGLPSSKLRELEGEGADADGYDLDGNEHDDDLPD